MSYVSAVLAVHCRYCGALPGEPCGADQSGHKRCPRGCWPHAERVEAWRAMGLADD